MRVEFETTGNSYEMRGGTLHSNEVQTKIITSRRYQKDLSEGSIKHIAQAHSETAIYDRVTSNSPLYDFQIIGLDPSETSEYKKAVNMSPSDLERGYKFPDIKASTPEAVQGAVFGIGGHTLVTIINEMTLKLRGKETLKSITGSMANLKPHEKTLIDYVAAPSLARYRSNNIRAIDIPYVGLDLWREIKKHYVFSKRHGSSKKALKEGTLYKAADVRDWWDKDMVPFEDAIVETFTRKFSRYELPLESMPNMSKRSVEKPFRNRLDWGPFHAQLQGVIDYLLINEFEDETRYLVIDEKFHMSESEPDYLTPINLAQSLLYCGMARAGQKYDQGDYTSIVPQNVMFLYNVFSLSKTNPYPYSYYINATVYPERMQEVTEVLAQAATNWWFHHKDLIQIKKEERAQIVMPYLPNPRDNGVDTQLSLL